MTRTDRTTVWIGLLLSGLALCASSLATAQAADAAAMPRSLHGGAPAERLPAVSAPRPRTQIAPRTAPAPSISLDTRARGGQAAFEHLAPALLEREIELLKRLVAHTSKRDIRRADALLRLSYALQELIWQQREYAHRLETRGHDCRRYSRASALGVAFTDEVAPGGQPSAAALLARLTADPIRSRERER
jgi:hypothetical protein